MPKLCPRCGSKLTELSLPHNTAPGVRCVAANPPKMEIALPPNTERIERLAAQIMDAIDASEATEAEAIGAALQVVAVGLANAGMGPERAGEMLALRVADATAKFAGIDAGEAARAALEQWEQREPAAFEWPDVVLINRKQPKPHSQVAANAEKLIAALLAAVRLSGQGPARGVVAVFAAAVALDKALGFSDAETLGRLARMLRGSSVAKDAGPTGEA